MAKRRRSSFFVVFAAIAPLFVGACSWSVDFLDSEDAATSLDATGMSRPDAATEGSADAVAEASLESGAVNLIQNASCDDGDTDWATIGGSPIQASTLFVHPGEAHSCRGYNRTATFEGPGQDVDPVVPGDTYSASVWVLWAPAPDAGAPDEGSSDGGSQTQSMDVSVQYSCGLSDGGTSSGFWRVATVSNVPAGQWNLASGTFAVPDDCSPNHLFIYVEGPGGGLDLYTDDFTLVIED